MRGKTKAKINQEYTVDNPPEYISVPALAHRWGYKDKTIYGWIYDKKIPAMGTKMYGRKISWKIPMEYVLKHEKEHHQRVSRGAKATKAA